VFHCATIFAPHSDIEEEKFCSESVDSVRMFLEEVQISAVKKVVLTSTATSMMDFSKGEATYDESHWTDLHGPMTKYIKSKILQEKAAWDYYNILDDNEKNFELSTINPGIIMGPILIKRNNPSFDSCITLLTGEKLAKCPQIYLGYVDVRDCAEAFFKVLVAAGNQRYAIAGPPTKLSQLGQIVHKHYAQYNYDVVHEDMGCFKMWVVSFFDSEVDYLYEIWNTKVTIDNSKSTKELGLNYRPIEITMTDMCDSLIEKGFVEGLRDKKQT
jgi:nucleoside-diphosphate-sugar epimerase